ncbi:MULTISPECIES: MoaD/ThiS family protein [unclassified Synechococcus]|jgi:molybdopterin synthase sulfur carrier subunit|uniref:MoaD/ThiS family protein n=1 Tax=unclassified Synechococcus TaxID=2626047 RepID=UPI000E0F0434|nr:MULTISPECIES: MoaD/ThiS family protein [unclassified Synechococcus]NKB75015.1 molybdopterin synthase sulfur carrier subunit [Synechococcus sp. s2_metabat2_7]
MTKSPERTLQVLLFASLRDQAGWDEQCVFLPDKDVVTAEDIWDQLKLGPRPASVQISINQRLVSSLTPVQIGDEVAFLPPFTGG